MIKKERTERGFYTYSFVDTYDVKYNITESSTACVDRIWLQTDVSCRIMKSHAERLGMDTGEGECTGWMDYPLPKEAHLFGALHLGRKEAEDIVEVLNEFIQNSEYDEYYNDDYRR